MKGCIAGSQYIPSIEYFVHWKHHGHLLLEKEEHYQKRSWRNKTTIQGHESPLILTVPLKKGKNNHQLITDVQIAYDTPWQKIHLHSIKAAYGKTAFFDEILPGLEQVYQTDYSLLWDLNNTLLKYITSFLRGNWTYEVTTEYHHMYDQSINDLRAGVPCGLTSYNSDSFPEYPQVHRLHQTHQPNLCILDVLCHLGPYTMDYLEQVEAKLYEKR